jgi:hypothetical protein
VLIVLDTKSALGGIIGGADLPFSHEHKARKLHNGIVQDRSWERWRILRGLISNSAGKKPAKLVKKSKKNRPKPCYVQASQISFAIRPTAF